MGSALARFSQICSGGEQQRLSRELQQASEAKTRTLETELAESRRTLAENCKTAISQAERVQQLEAELSQSQRACAAVQQELHDLQAVSATQQRQIVEDRVAFETKLGRASQELHDCSRLLADLRTFVDNANAPIIAVDRAGKITECNKKAAEVLHTDAESAITRQMADYVHKEDRANFCEFQASVLSDQALDRVSLVGVGHLQCKFRMRTRQNGDTWNEVLICASPRLTPHGLAEGALYICQDLSQPSKIVMEAELNVKDLRRIIMTINAPIIGVNQDGVIDEWNRKAELLTGYSESEASGMRLSEITTEEFVDSAKWMLFQAMQGREITNYEFPISTKSGQRREILWSATARRNRRDEVIGVIGVGQDITELRSESKMLANYVRICGAAVWSLRGDVITGVVTDSKTKEIEHLISQQAQMDVCDPRMVLWRASFISILKTMCQNFWVRRKEKTAGDRRTSGFAGEAGGTTPVGTDNGPDALRVTTDFAYEFCFEAPNGSVKWYKVAGHLIQECVKDSQFEVSGSMQEVTSMLIDKVMGDRWQKWWNRMCHMVFDATLLVDTQEYRVLNAWGEEKVFGRKLQSNHALLQLIKPEDADSLKAAFNEVTFKGFERGRTLHMLRPVSKTEVPAQCFLLSADQENPNECMMGIRMQVSATNEKDSVLWDVSKPNPVLTLEDLARLKSGLKRSHRRPLTKRIVQRPHRSRSDPHTSSHSLSSIIEEDGDFEEDDDMSVSDRGSEAADSVAEDTESLHSSSKSSNSSRSDSEVGVCNSSPARSAIEEWAHRPDANLPSSLHSLRHGLEGSNPFRLSPKMLPASPTTSPTRTPKEKFVRTGPPLVKLRWGKQSFDLNLDNFSSVGALRVHIQGLTGVLSSRQTLILGGKRLPLGEDPASSNGGPSWHEIRDNVRAGSTLMMVGRQGTDAPEKDPPAQRNDEPDEDPPLAAKCDAEGAPSPDAAEAVAGQDKPLAEQ